MRRIRPLPGPKTVEVAVPGSKSYTHRMLVAAALSDGRCTIDNALDSEDTRLTLDTLKRWGTAVGLDGTSLTVFGTGGRLAASAEPVFLGNSGTSMRLLTAVAALAPGRSLLTGTERLQARPMQDLLDGLARLGVRARSLGIGGGAPIEIDGGTVPGGCAELDCSLSSQFLTALLLIGPYARDGIEVCVTRGPVSRPYIDITLDMMRRFGVEVERRGYEWFKVPGGGCYRAADHGIEADCSQAGYFWAAAAVTGSTVKVKRTAPTSCQGDARLPEILGRMGCTIAAHSDGVSVTGRSADRRRGGHDGHARRRPDARGRRGATRGPNGHSRGGASEGEGERPAGRRLHGAAPHGDSGGPRHRDPVDPGRDAEGGGDRAATTITASP